MRFTRFSNSTVCALIVMSAIYSCMQKKVDYNENLMANDSLNLERKKSQLGVRHYKEDTFQFYYLIQHSNNKSIDTLDVDSIKYYKGNIFLIQPKRY